MIKHRWYDTKNETDMVIIACGCCTHEFIAEVGGMAFCGSCLNGHHRECNVAEIMGIGR